MKIKYRFIFSLKKNVKWISNMMYEFRPVGLAVFFFTTLKSSSSPEVAQGGTGGTGSPYGLSLIMYISFSNFEINIVYK